MYAIAIVRYRKALEEVLAQQPAHRAYLRDLEAQGLLIASGPLSPRFGGALLLRVPDDQPQQAVDSVRDHDPFVISGVAQYEVLLWEPGIGRERLDAIPWPTADA